MKQNEFDRLCQRYAIAPSIALENNNVVDCLLSMRETKDSNSYAGYRNILVQILETEF